MQADFLVYVTRPEWLQKWGNLPQRPEEWDAAVTYPMRGHAAFVNLWYGALANPVFWPQAAAYAGFMSLVAPGFWGHLFIFVLATALSYALAPLLPLKAFTGDAWAVGLNGVRLFVPFLLAGLAFGRVALGSSLVSVVAAGLVAVGAHELFHPARGYLLKDRKFLTDTLERRLAVTGVSLPVNYGVVQRFVGAGQAMDVDVKADPKKV